VEEKVEVFLGLEAPDSWYFIGSRKLYSSKTFFFSRLKIDLRNILRLWK
jgi:hypothetical protein